MIHVHCVYCNATGKYRRTNRKCDHCGGSGYVQVIPPTNEWRRAAERAQRLAREALHGASHADR